MFFIQSGRFGGNYPYTPPSPLSAEQYPARIYTFPTTGTAADVWTSYSQGLPTGPGGGAVSANQPLPWHGRVVDIPSQYWADIDQGRLQARRSDLVSSFGSDTDAMMRAVDCLASDFTYLGGSWETWKDWPTTSADQSVVTMIPAGTRKLRIHQRGWRSGGTENSAYFSNIRIQLEVSGNLFVSLYGRRGPQLADFLNTSTTNNLIYGGLTWGSVIDETGLATGQGAGLGGNQAATTNFWQDFDLASFHGVLAAVEAGKAQAYAARIGMEGTSNESLSFHTETLDAVNAITVVYTATSALQSTGQFFGNTSTVPTNAKKLRFRYSATRNDGVFLDATISFVHHGIFYPAYSAVALPTAAQTRISLRGEGADANVVFTDYSGTPKTMTANGNVQHDTGYSGLRGQSIFFDGTGDFISTPHNTELDVGVSSDFCIEAFIRVNGIVNKINTIMAKRDTATGGGYQLSVLADGSVHGSVHSASGEVLTVTTPVGTIIANSDYHIAFTRQGTTGRIFIQGTKISTATQVGTATDNTFALRIGSNADLNGGAANSRDFIGWINHVRLVIGNAVYTDHFDLPATPYTFG